MPNVGISIRLKSIPIVNDMIASLRLRLVFPWLFIRLSALKEPRAVKRKRKNKDEFWELIKLCKQLMKNLNY